MPHRKKLVINDLPVVTWQKMVRLREQDGFGLRTWGDWLAYVFSGKTINETSGDAINEATRVSMFDLWARNFGLNLPDILDGDTITDLVPENPEIVPKGPSVTVGAGPSIWKHEHLDLLKEAIDDGRFKGIVCATDRMLIPCLERKIVPFITAGVDGSYIIKKFYDHPLVEKYSSQIKAVINATTEHGVIEHCKKVGIHIYWFHPMFDDPTRNNESLTRLQKAMATNERHPNGVPAMGCGGNAGTATWTLAHALLRRSPNALVGFDMGYPEGSNLEHTPYFSALQVVARPSELISGFYKEVYHPVFKTKAIYDDVFKSYRASLRHAVLRTPPWCETINCTEGGTLWGERIKCMKFKTWLDSL